MATKNGLHFYQPLKLQISRLTPAKVLSNVPNLDNNIIITHQLGRSFKTVTKYVRKSYLVCLCIPWNPSLLYHCDSKQQKEENLQIKFVSGSDSVQVPKRTGDKYTLPSLEQNKQMRNRNQQSPASERGLMLQADLP